MLWILNYVLLAIFGLYFISTADGLFTVRSIWGFLSFVVGFGGLLLCLISLIDQHTPNSIKYKKDTE